MKAKHQQRAGKEIVTHGSGNVFSDLGFSRDESAELEVKAELTRQIHNRVKEMGLTQERAARQLGASQPDVSRLMSGRHTGYSIERLISMLNALEVDVDIILRPKVRNRAHSIGRIRVMEVAA